MADWGALTVELTAWKTAGITPRLWWRDDDAQTVTPDLMRLLELSDTHGVPVHLSVIPQGLCSDLAPRLQDTPHAHVLQHGLAHINHEPKGAPASEVGDTRETALQMADLRAGWEILTDARMPRLLPGLVPPWNRISDATRRLLPDLGYRYLSSYEGRGDAGGVSGLIQIDAHLDPIRWKYGRVFRGRENMLDMLLTHLRDRRESDPAKPIGYVTHHLQTPPDVWNFTDQLFQHTGGLWHSLPDLAQEK